MAKPSAIIAKLEDCRDWLDRRLLKNYWEAGYRLESWTTITQNYNVGNKFIHIFDVINLNHFDIYSSIQCLAL